MKKLNHFIINLIFISVVLSACSPSVKEEIRISPEHTKQGAIQTASEPVPQPTQEKTQASGEIQAKTPRLTLESTSEEIREKMLSSSFYWQTLEVEAVSENSSLNTDDSVANTRKYQIHTWIDQQNLYFRTEEMQEDVQGQSKLAVSDGSIMVNKEADSMIEGYPVIPGSTYVSRVISDISNEEAFSLLKNGEAIFPPMGSVYSGSLNTQLFSSAYAVQYPVNYEAIALETIAGRETLKVFFEYDDGWGDIEITLWIDTETGVVLKEWSDGTPNHFTSGMEITHIAYNIPLTRSLFNTEEAIPDLNLAGMQSQTIAGNTVYAGNQKVVDEQATVDVCFELPSTSDWMLTDMQVNGKENMNMMGYLIYVEPAGTRQTKGLRCDELVFPVVVDQDSIHIEIGQLFAPAREGTACNSSDKVSQALIDAGTPIEFTCEEDHGMTITEILSKPDTMTEEEAKTKVHELFVQFRYESLPGPWVFEIPLEQE